MSDLAASAAICGEGELLCRCENTSTGWLRAVLNIRIWAELFEAWLALTSVKYHDNLLILTLLNQWLALTMLRATNPRVLAYDSGTQSVKTLFQGFLLPGKKRDPGDEVESVNGTRVASSSYCFVVFTP